MVIVIYGVPRLLRVIMMKKKVFFGWLFFILSFAVNATTLDTPHAKIIIYNSTPEAPA